MSSMVKNAQCPACAGVVEFAAGRALCRCLYCGASLLFLDETHCPRRFIEPCLEEKDLDDHVKRLLSSGPAAEIFVAEAVLEHPCLVWLPLFEVRGTSFVSIEDSHWEMASGQGARRVEDRKLSLRDIEYHEFAVKDEALAVTSIDLDPLRRGDLKGRLRSFDRQAMGEHAQIFSPDRTVDQVEAQFIQREKTTKFRAGLTSDLLGRTSTLLYYPLWVVRYPFRGSLYRFVVDGATGVVLHGRCPESPKSSALMSQLLLLAAAVFAWFFYDFASRTAGVGPVGLVLTLAIALAGTYGVWLRLCYGREVVVEKDEMYLVHGIKREPTFFERAIDGCEAFLLWRWYGLFGK